MSSCPGARCASGRSRVASSQCAVQRDRAAFRLPNKRSHQIKGCLSSSALADGGIERILQHMPLADVPAVSAPFAALGAAAVSAVLVAALRAYCYSQVEFVTAAMLSRNLQQSGSLRIIQLGGGTRELYYYPKSTVQVTVVGEDLKLGLYDQAGISAGVPVVCRREAYSSIADMGGASADAIVCLTALQDIPDLVGFYNTVYRLLKPGGRFIFVQPVMSGSASFTQVLAGTSGDALDFDKLEPLKRLSGFTSVAWDVANEAADPHAVGMAVKQTKVSKGR